MWTNILRHRPTLLALFVLYWLPTLLLVHWAEEGMDTAVRWTFFAEGLLLASGGSLLFAWVLTGQKEETGGGVPQEELDQAMTALRAKEAELVQLQEEKEAFEKQLQTHQTTLTENTASLQERLSTQKKQTTNYEEILAQKDKEIEGLSQKVDDLEYEIKTLLHVIETPHTPPEEHPLPPSPNPKHQAMALLKRCLAIAAQSGASHPFAFSNSRLRDMPVDNYALDLRRLFDRLQTEKGGLILICSPKEGRVLFAGREAERFLGWNPEAFVKNFYQITHQDRAQWQQTVHAIKNDQPLSIHLECYTADDLERPLEGVCARVPDGTFRHHAIAVLYPQ